MGAPLIRIDPESLQALENRLDALVTSVCTSVHTDLTSAPEVEHSYRKFLGRWDENLDKLFKDLRKTAKAARKIRENFTQTDTKFANQLQASASE